MIPKSEFSKNIVTLIGGSGLSQLFMVLITPILTRLYSPEEFGAFALFISIIALFSPLASARYEQAVILAEDEEIYSLLALGVIIVTGFSLMLLIILLIFNQSIYSLIDDTVLQTWLYFIPLNVFLLGVYNLIIPYYNRIKKYQKIAGIQIAKSLSMSLFQVVLVWIKEGVFGLILGQILGQIIATFVLITQLSPGKLYRAMKRETMGLICKKYGNFPRFQIPHVFCSTASSNLPVYIFSGFFHVEITGLYSLSTRIVLMPLGVVTSSASKVYNQHLVELLKNNEDGYAFTIGFLKSLAWKLFLLIGVFTLFAPDIFAFVFGQSWREAGVYAQLLSVGIFFNALVSTVAYIPSVLKMQKKAFHVSVVQLILYVFALSSGVFMNDVYVSLISFSATSVIVLLYNLQWFLKALKYKSLTK